MSFQIYSENTTNVNRDSDSANILQNPYNINLSPSFYNLVIKNNATFHDLIVTGTFIINKSIYFNFPTFFYSPLYIDSSLSVTGPINVLGNLNVTGNINILGNLNETGNLTTKSLSVTGTYTLNGPLNLTGNFQATSENTVGNYYLSGNLNNTGTMEITNTNNSTVISNYTGFSSSNSILIGNGNSTFSPDGILVGHFNRNVSGNDSGNVYFGNFILYENIASNTVFIGNNILTNAVNNQINNNVFLSQNFLQSFTGITGTQITENTYLGVNLLSGLTRNTQTDNTIGGINILTGSFATNSFLNQNVVIGNNIGQNLISYLFNSLDSNILLGSSLLQNINFGNTTISSNILIGYSLVDTYNTVSSFANNTVIGSNNLNSNSSLGTISNNLVIGQNCLSNNSLTSFTNNISIGSSASYMVNVSTMDSCISIGSSGTFENFVLTTSSNRILIGTSGAVFTDNSFILGNLSSSTVQQTKVGIGVSSPSGSFHIKGSVNSGDTYPYFLVEDSTHTGRYVVSVNRNGMLLDQVSSPLSSYNVPLSIYMTYSMPLTFVFYYLGSPTSDFITTEVFLTRISNQVTALLFLSGGYSLTNINDIAVSGNLPIAFEPVTAVGTPIILQTTELKTNPANTAAGNLFIIQDVGVPGTSKFAIQRSDLLTITTGIILQNYNVSWYTNPL